MLIKTEDIVTDIEEIYKYVQTHSLHWKCLSHIRWKA